MARRAGAPPFIVAAGHAGAVLTPALLAAIQPLPQMPFSAALCVFCGLAALVMLFVQYVTSGRFELLAGRIGLDVMMGFHRFAARMLLVLLVLHIALAVWLAAGQRPDGVAAALVMFRARGMMSGSGAALLLLGLTILAVQRDRLRIRYEVWRASHGAAAVGALLLALDHAWRNAVTLQFTSVAAAIGAGAGAALIAAFSIYVLRWLRKRGSWIVERVQPAGGQLHQLTLRQTGGRPFAFRAGQFVWVTFGGRHPISDHPFSIASSPDELPRLRLLIKESGDFTGAIAGLAERTPASIDGPHGNFIPQGQSQALVLVAGGVGIAPIIGILRDLAARAYPGRVALLFATRTEQEQIFAAEIGRLAGRLDLRQIYCVEAPTPRWTGAQGRVDEPNLTQLLAGIDPAHAEVLLCGPVGMMAAASETLLRLGVPLRRIRYERFDYDEADDPRSRRMRAMFTALFLAIGAGLILTAFGATTGERSAESGAVAFTRACASCHDIARWQTGNPIAATPRSRAELDAFLSRHHAGDPATRGAVIDYLAAQRR